MSAAFEIFLQGAPGLEEILAEEAREAGFAHATPVPGGVTLQGQWTTVWRANLRLRGANAVLARIGGFPASHLAQLDKRARGFAWGEVLRADVPVRVEVVTSQKSKIYHAGAAQERIERALSESFGATIDAEAPVTLKTRIQRDYVQFSVDTSGEGLHKRGHKPAVGKAPMRETLAALFLRQAGYRGDEPVLDPMCGSGTFVLEAAEIAAGLWPGRDRSFAFEQLAGFKPDLYARIRAEAPEPQADLPRFHGSDRNAGAVEMATRNAAAAGLSEAVHFHHRALSDLERPAGKPGLVIINPPYGARIGDRRQLFALYGRMGEVLRERFSGWRAAIVTSDGGLARASGLPFLPTTPPVDHGGIRVTLYQTAPLA
ncbi:MAG: class I SAM-dependent RNA methyltransferase [Rhodobacteraceae bacterium]|nr:class I SAM-dependent RNA methyltransferase [Paracoccaceae bacterium]MBR9821767.1 class I SAM-dependent RNA methyltransferase [Paracoccaceae bacterium]